jgi:fumarate hydratase subunit alpha
MKEIPVSKVTKTIARLCIEANTDLGNDVEEAFRKMGEAEDSPTGKEVLELLLKNAQIAREERMPICQDTGLAVVFIDVGQEVHFTGGDLEEAIHEGVRQGYEKGYLRKSTCHPFTRKNLGDNTPAIIHTRIVPGDKVHVTVEPKGGGSENMSRVVMLAPSEGIEGIKSYILQRVRESGSNPCPPIVVGVGIGGTFERAAFLAKRATLRPIGTKNPDPELDALERELLEKINRIGIGPAGLGGRTTALAVHIEMMPCHIASLPLAVNIQCHAGRHKEAVL